MNDADKINQALDRLSAPKITSAADFPVVPEGYWDQVVEILPERAPRVKDGAPQERGQHLESLIDQALDKLEEVLAIPIDMLSDDPLKLISIQKDAAIAVVNLANKVDENRFRKKSADAITSILQQVVDKEKSLGLTVVVDATRH